LLAVKTSSEGMDSTVCSEGWPVTKKDKKQDMRSGGEMWQAGQGCMSI